MAFIIPYFIQHQGCPHRCLFCDQNAITGERGHADKPEENLEHTIAAWLPRNRKKSPVQLAFYGGSFTCLPEPLQHRLLASVNSHVRAGTIASIRLSTRPDCISDEICVFLKYFGVATVELGVQSMSDKVLETAKRGHDAKSVRRAAELVQKHGLQLGIQLMIGLPGETTTSFLQGVKEVAGIGPAFVRLYPAVVLKNTGLALLYRNSGWRPLSMNRAVTYARKARNIFRGQGVRVIRMGLQHSQELEEKLLAGPYHPSFGECVIARDWYLKARAMLATAPEGAEVTVQLAASDYSAFVGPAKSNLNRLCTLFPEKRLVLETDKTLERFQYRYAVN